MKQTRTVGILAHVDAGKTTLSEQILFQAHTIRRAGRVDHQDSFLDTNPLEKQRGITIFCGQAPFVWKEAPWYLVDTPGHGDFSPEMERCLRVLDAAVVVVSAVEGIQSHTETIWRLLRQYQIPTFFFINKIDRAGADPEGVINLLAKRFHTRVCPAEEGISSPMMDAAAEQSDELLEAYLAGNVAPEQWSSLLLPLLRHGEVCPAVQGSALAGTGVEPLLHILDTLTPEPGGREAPFGARVYQIRRDRQGNRVAFLRVTGGRIRPRDSIGEEKVSELRRYSGEKYQPLSQAEAGDLCAVTGLSSVKAGESLGAEPPALGISSEPMLTASVEFDRQQCPSREMLALFRLLEEEEPALRVQWLEELQEIRVQVMGTIQLEVLREEVQARFGQEISFGRCRVLYRETIAAPIEGRGHFEPLRHYAEVRLRLEPGPRGSGIQFVSLCSTDRLALHWQRLIETHVLEKEHKGVLTGSPVTDLRICLLDGRSHEKHTEGGDFREAVYRAIRQGLMKAESILLEPWYAFEARVPAGLVGRLFGDVQQMGGSLGQPETEEEMACVQGRAPVSGLLDYGRELTSYTRGRGTLSLRPDGYEPCKNQEAAVAEIGYDPERDTENPAGSVFCSHGAGFPVPWQEADRYMHLD